MTFLLDPLTFNELASLTVFLPIIIGFLLEVLFKLLVK